LVSQYAFIDGRRVDLADLDRSCLSTILGGGVQQQLGYFLDGSRPSGGGGSATVAER
jgi:hypothetical protein